MQFTNYINDQQIFANIIKKKVMNKKTIENAAEVVKTIKSEVKEDVIKSHRINDLVHMQTAETTGYAITFDLSTKFNYSSNVLDDWKERLDADHYIISVKRNQLSARFEVHFDD